ncbi:MAG: nucleotide exchange factor GrpE, partial [Flavobacteriaceae bacterium]|nr:nucleotide exchange factor GrpE [Flavobacteriaceae bacterium]
MAEKKQRKKKPTLKDQISELNSQVNDEKDKFLRLFAEFENYRKRTAKERLELFKTASQELMTALLPIADDMDRALSELKKSENDENLQGFELIYSKFNDILKTKGLTQIDVKIGDKFDSENHEAITQIKADKDKNVGCIILTGAGKSFSSGGNLQEIKDMTTKDNMSLTELEDWYRFGIQKIPLTMNSIDVPIVAAVNGHAIGAGNDLCTMCD